MKKIKEEKVNILKYTKDSILKSSRYSERKDILNILLKENEEYTLEDVETKLNEFMKGEII